MFSAIQRTCQTWHHHTNLISGLKHDLSGRYYAMEEDLQSTVIEFFAKQDAEWYSAGIHKLILRYNKCLDEQCDYVEK